MIGLEIAGLTVITVAFFCATYVYVQKMKLDAKKDSTAKLRAQVQELREFQEAQVASINSAVDAAAKAHALAVEATQRVGRLEVSASLRSPPLGS